jgi:hypothetical protein
MYLISLRQIDITIDDTEIDDAGAITSERLFSAASGD